MLPLSFLLLSACRTTKPDPERAYPVISEQPISVNPPLLPDTSTYIPPAAMPAETPASQSFELQIQEIEVWKTQDPGPTATDESALYYAVYVRDAQKPEAEVYKGGWTHQDLKAPTIFSADCAAYRTHHPNAQVPCETLSSTPLRFRVLRNGSINVVMRLMELDDDADFATATQVIGGLTVANNAVRLISKAVPQAGLVTEWVNYVLLGANVGVRAANAANQDDILGELSDWLTWGKLSAGRYQNALTFQGKSSEYQYKVRYLIRTIR